MAAQWYDLTNLMQGLAGGVLGSLAAALVAVYTVRQTWRAERQAVIEARRDAAVEEVHAALRKVDLALGSYRIGLSYDEGDETSRLATWRRLDVDDRITELREIVRRRRPALHGLSRQLLRAEMQLFLLATKISVEGRAPELAETQRAEKSADDALRLLEQYLSDPIPVMRRLRRLDRRADRRARVSKWWRKLTRRDPEGRGATGKANDSRAR